MSDLAARRLRTIAALATAFVAVLTLASSLSPDVPWRSRVLDSFEPNAAHTAAHVAGVLGGVGLLLLAGGMLRGRRRAGNAAIAVLAVLAAVNAAKGLDFEEAALALALAALLRLVRRRAERGDAPATPGIAAGLVAVAALAAAYAVAVTALLLSGHPPGVARALGRAAHALATGAQPAWLDGDGRLVVHLMLGLALLTGVACLRALLAPARPHDGHDEREHARAAAIVAQHGRDPLAPFVLRADKAFFFAHGAVLAYRTLRETAVVSGDPIGPPGAVRAVMADFLAFAGERGWDVVVTAAGPDRLDDYRALGLRTMRIGSEAVVDPAAFSLEGRAIRKVRQSVNRIARRGWTIDVVEARALTRELVAELRATETAWRATAPRRRGFAMSMDRLWGAPEDARDVYVTARAPDGAVHAFLRFVAHREGLSLDAMRRLDDAPNGLNEALVVAALAHARAAGHREVSLNFAGFAHVMAADAILTRGGRVLRALLRLVHRRFQFERLVAFNEKFEPSWRARHLVYTSQTRLPLAALRVLQAESYVPCPRLLPRRAAWRPLPNPIEHPVGWTGPA